MSKKVIYLEPPNALPASIDYIYGLPARGPDYGVGVAPPPEIGSEYRPPTPIVIPENWAWEGPADIRSLKWQLSDWMEAGPLTAPTYNSAEPQILYRLQIISPDKLATWETNNNNLDIIPLPTEFEAGGPATLYGGRSDVPTEYSAT